METIGCWLSPSFGFKVSENVGYYYSRARPSVRTCSTQWLGVETAEWSRSQTSPVRSRSLGITLPAEQPGRLEVRLVLPNV